MSLTGKIAIVTGAGSGIGRATALALVLEGCYVVLAGRKRETLAATQALSGDGANRVLVVPTDVANPASVHALLRATRVCLRPPRSALQ